MAAAKGTERVNFGASTLRAYEVVLHQTDSPTYDTTLVAPTGQSANATITMPSATGTLVTAAEVASDLEDYSTAAEVTSEIAAAVAAYVPKAATTNYSTAFVGVTAGFELAAVYDAMVAVVQESTAAATLVIPVSPIRVGASIVSFAIAGALTVASGSDPATVDAVLWRMPSSGVAVNLGAITQVALTESAAFTPSKTLTAPHTVLAGNSYYIVVTATTGANESILISTASVTTA